MNEFGLDAAVIGNGCTAAPLEPSSRLVWWCFPRFDSDPIFCRLLSGDEEKGFSDARVPAPLGRCHSRIFR
jgi:Trehalase-like, N-terminal